MCEIWDELREADKLGRAQFLVLRQTWRGMHRRCKDSSIPSWENYGGRGITVDSRWDSLIQFCQDMGARPSDKHSLDRINNDAGYSPENCRWAESWEQNGNKRGYKTNTSGARGVWWDKQRGRWEAVVYRKGVKVVLYKGKDFEEAVKARARWDRSFSEGMSPAIAPAPEIVDSSQE